MIEKKSNLVSQDLLKYIKVCIVKVFWIKETSNTIQLQSFKKEMREKKA